MNLLVYSFAVFGSAWVVGHSKISLPLRTWLAARSKFLIDLLECVGCLSFHVGWITWLTGIRLTGSWGHPWLDVAVAALYTAASSLVIGRFAGVVD